MQDTDLRPSPDPADTPGHWLRLQQCAGVGPGRGASLLSRFHCASAIFRAPPATVADVVGHDLARALLAPPDARLAALIAATHAWLDAPGHHFLTLHDAAYPPLLRFIPDPPLCLYVDGNPALLSCPALAIVGSRHASMQGMANAHAFAAALSQAGLTIVSGMAQGIDAAAHVGGLQGQGATIAVLGTGIDAVYPRQHKALSARIAAQGCLVSEYPLGYPVLKDNFPRRNRLISGMSEGVLVVEAALGSGSLITARCAIEQGRDVFAMPGSIHAPLAKGCHQLIREGAKLVDTVGDVTAELRFGPAVPVPASPAGPRDLSGSAAVLLGALGHAPADLDLLAQATGCAAGELSSELLALELSGHIERLPGGKFQRIVR